MIIKIDREEKIKLLEFVQKGEIDTRKIERIYNEIKGNSDFLELMMRVDAENAEREAAEAQDITE